MIPENTVTTGVTFHYDRPNSEPPQCWRETRYNFDLMPEDCGFFRKRLGSAVMLMVGIARGRSPASLFSENLGPLNGILFPCLIRVSAKTSPALPLTGSLPP